ncbi:ABC transporter permease [Spirosoma utsteinense]|uniref:Permease n=1 Tax=Spirosoma utsteinense TaxID=2585773 RepID=A0ABR6W210_9BACT|nr:ABC transporter permease [Spirosoma utsteinense]MBC3785133.1 putative permease [Spirosoma utsteinense]MBC3790641.1 putative permease [Spirosoma utsteinense]
MKPPRQPPSPPRWAQRLLSWWGHPDTREETQGDLLELYDYWVQTAGKRRADWRYSLSTLKLLRPLAQTNTTQYPSPFFLNATMIRNYFIIAWRNLIRNKAFSGINILGLALGMSCSLLILLWVQDERGVDAFHANGSQLYQVYERQYYDGKIEANYFTQGLLADELKRVIPEVQLASGLEDIAPITFEAGKTINKQNGTFAGADFFQMFSYPLLQGTPATALSRPGGIAVSRRMAEQFFGNAEQAIGKSIRYQDKEDLQVTAVFENIPANSSQQFDFLRPWVDFVKLNEWAKNWGNTNPLTFVQLRTGTDPVKVEAKIKEFIYQYRAKNTGSRTELALQPYPEKYLHSTFKNGQVDGGRIEYVRLFSLVALFILLIACVNFMNLATARSTKRAKEVGVRKVIGAVRSALMGQFVGEAMLITFLAILIAVMLVSVLLPGFSMLTGKQLTLPIDQPQFWAMLLGLLALTGLVSGSYPAFFLSSLSPARVLKGGVTFKAGATLFRKGLVVFQFSLSIILIVGMIVMYRQTDYIQTKNLGYNRENLIYIPLEGDLSAKYDLLKEEAGKLPGILSLSRMRESPTQIGHHINDANWTGKDPNLVTSFANTAVEYDFVKTMKLQLSEGRDFDRSFGIDSLSYLINETALAKIGYKNPIGKPLSWGQRQGTIIGVLKDFHFTSMHQAIEPLIVRLDNKRQWGTILVRTEAGKTSEALAGLETLCRELNPKFPFTYQFSDQEFDKLYKSEQVVSQLANYFALLAIFISCLGLFGLSTFTAEQRTKEIGVRKVLGASVASVVTLLSTDFLKLVLIALVIATPVAWYVMNQWLRGFVYKIDIEWWMLAVAGLVAVCIAFVTISFQSVKAALMNPVKSLRSE